MSKNVTPKVTPEKTEKPEELSAETAQKSPAALREEAVLAFWRENDIFQKSLAQESPKGNFVFYDGPPYATGLPHAGHMLPSTVKDIIPRYKTMRGYHVPRRWGWDCHGLPIENLIEKELGLKDKKAIEDYGIDKFNKAARDSVFRYDKEWKRIVERIGRWVDMDNDYHTMDPSYTESVWWSFKSLSEKQLVYEAYKVMPFCPRCQTTLSNFEVGQGYKDIQDISVYAKFELADEPGTFFLAWTTTPWTLPGNVALAVSPDMEYSLVEIIGGNADSTASTKLWIASDLLPKLVEKKIIAPDSGAEAAVFTVLKRVKGSELAGISYLPVFDFYTKEGTMLPEQEKKRANAWKVYAADFVTAEDGTGIVHVAPAFGGDDLKLAEAQNLPVIHHVAPNGVIKEGNGPFTGMVAKPIENPQLTDIEVIKVLAHTMSKATKHGEPSSLLFAKEKITHPYPHCWRCNTPLLNYATSSWFIQVTKLRDQLVEENKKVNWVPKEVGEGRFGEWLENVRDWAVSRSRYWGAPLPIWRAEKSGKTEFIGSVAELKAKIKGNGNTITLMRHGEATSNLADGINSSPDELNKCPLTETGVGEVAASVELLKEEAAKTGKNISVIYASDFCRCRQTAEAVATALGFDHSKIIYDKRLREINAGDFDGKTWADRASFFRNLHEKIFKKCPNGESVYDVKMRTAEFLYDVDSKHKDENILVVTHGLPLRMMVATSVGRTARDLLRSGWSDISNPTASLHVCDFKQLPHNETFELDLHRPYIDAVTWTNEEGETMKRVPEVLDVWYDSGCMPYAQNHYPFENKELFEMKGSPLFPADFIAEGVDQTRGWFYSLIVLSTSLFGHNAYKNVSVNGLMLAEDGRKMSKSLRNYPDLEVTLDKFGADSLRYMLAASPATHAEEVLFSEKGLDEVVKKLFNRLENVYSFYEMYAGEAEQKDESNAAEENGDAGSLVPESDHVLDAWIISRLSELKSHIEKGLDSYQIDKAARPIADFIDDLSTWYLRRSRDRFKGDDVEDKIAAIATTRFVLLTLSKLMAPFVPFMAEHVYLKLKNSGAANNTGAANNAGNGKTPESVHLCAWPELPEANEDLITSMANLRKLVETGLAMRSKAGIKVRQPLASFTYDGNTTELSSELAAIVGDELNVKKVEKGSEIFLDTNLTEDLKKEGAVRDLIRGIQERRKDAQLETSDRIRLVLAVKGEKSEDEENLKKILKEYEEMISKAVLATEILIETPSAGSAVEKATNEEGGANKEGIDVGPGKIFVSISPTLSTASK